MHEVHTTIRLLQKEPITWSERSEVYSQISKRAVSTLLKFVGPSVLGYLIATSLRTDGQILLKVSSFEAALPAAYFLFSLSFLFLFLMISLNNLSTSLSLKSSNAGKMLISGFSISAYDAINGKEELSLGLPMTSYGHWHEKLRLTSIVSLLLMVSLFSILIPLGAFGYFLLLQHLSILMNESLFLAERAASAFGLLIVITGAFSFLVFHIPMPFAKNTLHVRWGFLWKLPIAPTDDERHARWHKKS